MEPDYLIKSFKTIEDEDHVVKLMVQHPDLIWNVDSEGNTLFTRALELGSEKVFSVLVQNDWQRLFENPGQKPTLDLIIHCRNGDILYRLPISAEDIEFDFVAEASFRVLEAFANQILSEASDRAHLMLNEVLKYQKRQHIYVAKFLLCEGIRPSQPIESPLMERLVEREIGDPGSFNPLDYRLSRPGTRKAIKTMERLTVVNPILRDIPVEVRFLIYEQMK